MTTSEYGNDKQKQATIAMKVVQEQEK